MGLGNGRYDGRTMTKPAYKILSLVRKHLASELIDFGYISKFESGFKSQLFQVESVRKKWKIKLFGHGESTYIGEFTLNEDENSFSANYSFKRTTDTNHVPRSNWRAARKFKDDWRRESLEKKLGKKIISDIGYKKLR